MKFLLLLCYLFGTNCLTNDSFELISTFVKVYKPNVCIFIDCGKNQANFQIQKLIQSDHNIPTTFLSIEEAIHSQLNAKTYGRVAYIVNVSCDEKDIIKKILDYEKLKQSNKWFVILNCNLDQVKIRDVFKGIRLRLDMRFYVAVQLYENIYKIFEVYSLDADTVVNKVGIFANGTLQHINKNYSFYESRKNMKGLMLRTGNTVNYTTDYEEELRYKGASFAKFNFKLFLILKQIHNFTFNTTIRTAWFGNSSSGIDSGLSRLLHEKKIDIGTAGGILRIPRISYYDYLLPYFKFRTCFFFRNPGSMKPGIEVLKPFASETWCAVIAAVFIMSSAITLAYWIDFTQLSATSKYSYFTSIIITISTFSQQGSAIFPQNLGGRIIYLNLLILSILLYNYYTSSLVSSLLSTKPSVLDTIKELYESNLDIGLEDQPYTTTYILQQRNNYYIQKLNSTKIYKNGIPNYLPPKEGIANVKMGGFAYHTEVTTVYPLIATTYEQNIICDLAEMDFVASGVIGIMLSKGSEFKEMFQISMVMMRQAGIQKREHNIWVPKKPECLLSSRIVSVGLNELFLVYLILIFGAFISIIIFMIEWLSTYMIINRDNAIFVDYE